jgi:hypothetical protein
LASNQGVAGSNPAGRTIIIVITSLAFIRTFLYGSGVMSTETFTDDQTRSNGELAAPSSYDLDERRWFALPEIARVAFAIAEIEITQENFEGPHEITKALVISTDLEEDAVKKANRALLQKGCLDRSGFLDPQEALSLSLSEGGYQFLEEEIKKVQ